MSYPVIAQQSAEVGRLLLVDQLHEAGAVHGVDGREDAAREQTKLQELGDGLVLCGFCQRAFTVVWGGETDGHETELHSCSGFMFMWGERVLNCKYSICWVGAWTAGYLLANNQLSFSSLRRWRTLWTCSSCFFSSSCNFSCRAVQRSFSFFFLFNGCHGKETRIMSPLQTRTTRTESCTSLLVDQLLTISAFSSMALIWAFSLLTSRS